MHAKRLLVEWLKVVARQLIGPRQIAEVVCRARVIWLPQFHKYVEPIMAAVPLGTRDVDRAWVEVAGLKATVGLRSGKLDDIAAVGTYPAAAEKLLAGLIWGQIATASGQHRT